MPRVRLLHWKAAEASPLIEALQKAPHEVEYDEQFAPALMKEWRERPPDFFVIDLSRLPSHGREIAIALRQSRKTRSVPVIFCNGQESKVSAIRSILPDALYGTTANVLELLERAKPPTNPSKPAHMMSRYGDRRALQKLGVKEGSKVCLIDPPAKCPAVLDGAVLVESSGDVTLCFLHDADGVRAQISRMRSLAATSKLWFLWRKKRTAQYAGVTDTLVRETAAGVGLVDYKICSVDETWTAMLFAVRREASKRGQKHEA